MKAKPIIIRVLTLMILYFYISGICAYCDENTITFENIRNSTFEKDSAVLIHVKQDIIFNLNLPCDGGLKVITQEYSVNNNIPVYCLSDSIEFMLDNSCISSNTYVIDFGDSTTKNSLSVNHHYKHKFENANDYVVSLKITGTECTHTITYHITIRDCFICEDCIGSFAPIPGEKYVVSAWVKEGAEQGVKTKYTKPQIYIGYKSFNSNQITYNGPFMAKGLIIDGWQRIEEEFTIPSSTDSIKIILSQAADVSTDSCFFDDLRIYPKKGSIKSYVYDPISMRLVAELDENNYATLYEYDEEGILIRIKKETERGIMTIKENRTNTFKKGQ